MKHSEAASFFNTYRFVDSPVFDLDGFVYATDCPVAVFVGRIGQ